MADLKIKFNPLLSDTELEDGRLLFSRQINFLKGVVQAEDLPEQNRVEISFCGRSNVGKSSLINALTQRKNLARTSNTPGRTQEINYYSLSNSHYLVDLPGYGYARMPPKIKVNRQRFLFDYLRGRATLRRVFALVDSRHGPKQIDHETFELLNTSAVSFQIVFTKADKIKVTQHQELLSMANKVINKYPVALPEIVLTSSKSNLGISYLRQSIAVIR